MTKRASLLALTALATLSGGIAYAIELPQGEVNRQTIETAYTGYEYIEIKFGLTQVKVEAVDAESGQKVEAVYNKTTGATVKTEAEAAGDYAGRSGIYVRSLTRDFGDDGDDNSYDDDSSDMSGDDDTSDSTGDDNTSDSSGGDDNTSDSTGGDDNTSDSTGGDDNTSDSTGGDDSTSND